jgi:O-methyltransferase
MDCIENDVRFGAFATFIRYINYETVPGDLVEIGIYTGRSLAMISLAQEQYMKNCIHTYKMRNVIGIDSFQGLAENCHPRWNTGIFQTNHSNHPLIEKGESVTKEKVLEFFEFLKLPKPTIICKDIAKDSDSLTSPIALIHIDCDLYEPSLKILQESTPFLQNGSIIAFDDWFNFKADPNSGEQRATKEWLEENKHVNLIQFLRYGTFCNAFVVRIND